MEKSPVHPGTALNITFSYMGKQLPEQNFPQGILTATSQKVVLLISFNPNHLK